MDGRILSPHPPWLLPGDAADYLGIREPELRRLAGAGAGDDEGDSLLRDACCPTPNGSGFSRNGLALYLLFASGLLTRDQAMDAMARKDWRPDAEAREVLRAWEGRKVSGAPHPLPAIGLMRKTAALDPEEDDAVEIGDILSSGQAALDFNETDLGGSPDNVDEIPVVAEGRRRLDNSYPPNALSPTELLREARRHVENLPRNAHLSDDLIGEYVLAAYSAAVKCRDPEHLHAYQRRAGVYEVVEFMRRHRGVRFETVDGERVIVRVRPDFEQALSLTMTREHAGEEDDEYTLEDCIRDDGADSPPRALLVREARGELDRRIEQMPEVLKHWAHYRFGWEATQEESGLLLPGGRDAAKRMDRAAAKKAEYRRNFDGYDFGALFNHRGEFPQAFFAPFETALEALPPQWRDFARRHYYRIQSPERMAGELGLTMEQITGRLATLEKHLEHALGEEAVLIPGHRKREILARRRRDPNRRHQRLYDPRSVDW